MMRLIAPTSSVHRDSFARELLLALGREAIELRALIGVGLRPFGRDPALLAQPLQRGIQRARFDLGDRTSPDCARMV